jgi:hypothetical protein
MLTSFAVWLKGLLFSSIEFFEPATTSSTSLGSSAPALALRSEYNEQGPWTIKELHTFNFMSQLLDFLICPLNSSFLKPVTTLEKHFELLPTIHFPPTIARHIHLSDFKSEET